MTRSDEIAAQTTIRRALLANGYTPLANKDKMCILRDWPRLHVDDAKIDEWSNQWKHRGTGVRIENGLVAIDLDIDDADAIAAIIDGLPDDIWALLESAPVRRGRGAKEAWFCRLADGDDAFYRLASAGFRADEAAESVQRVEIFASPDGGRQFGAFGAHTIGDDGEVAVAYEWAGYRSLLDVPLAELPVLTRAQLVEVARTATRVLDNLMWVRDLKSPGGYSTNEPIYDLDDQTFETRDHGQVDLAELEDLARLYDGVRLSASWLEGPSAVNMTRCIAFIHPGDDRVSILETAAHERHRPMELERRVIGSDMAERLRALSSGGKLFERVVDNGLPDDGPVAELDVPLGSDMDVVLDVLLAEYAYCATEQKPVLPIGGGGGMTLAAFRTLMLPHAVEVVGPRGGTKVINPVSMWECDARRVDVAGSRYRPDVSDRLCVVDGETFINTYRGPEAGDAGGRAPDAVAAFEGLLSHLLVREDERSWFRMWLAGKAQRPWVVGCGVLMVAEEQGTGRGTLINMVTSVYGARNVKPVTSIELMGGSGQGQYNAWQADSVLVTCDEVMAGDDGGGSMTWKRREAYEKLKQLVDPQRRAVTIRRKHIEAYETEVFCSFLLATNHTNALPLAHNDRRFAVLMQEDVKFDDRPGLAEAVNAWRPDGRFGPDFGDAVRRHLSLVAVDWDAIRRAPDMGEGRAIMQQQNEGDLADILRDVLSRVPGDVISNNDLKRRMQIALQAEGGEDGHKNWWVRVQDLLQGINSLGWRKMPTRQMYIGGDDKRKQVTVYYRAADGVRQAWNETPEADRWSQWLSATSDINRTISAVEQAARDGRLRPVR